MAHPDDTNRRLAAMLLSLSDQLNIEIEKISAEIYGAIEAVGLTSKDLELIEEGDTTDLEALARLSSALRVRIVIDPDFSARVVPTRNEIRFGAHENLHGSESHSAPADLRLRIAGRENSTVTAGQKVEQPTPSYAD